MSAVDLELPPNVPRNLTRPSLRYRVLTAAVAASLLAFLAIYVALLGLMAEDLRMSWIVFLGDGPYGWLGMLSLPFLAATGLVLLTSLFGFTRGYSAEDAVEITERQEPDLFRLIGALADGVGAPRPHKVFLVPGVNASVAYDSSLVNLVLPTRKNLYIGLGLVNALDRGQLNAVLAHEFGHFSQSTMSLGRWVYVAGAVIQRVTQRGPVDAVLGAGARIDLRITAVVVAIQVVLGAVRAAMGGLLWLLAAPERALSREMEFHADKVAVSLTGSDPLVEALARLQLADHAFAQVVSSLATRAQEQKFAKDLYDAHARTIADGPLTHPHLAPRAAGQGASARLFSEDSAPPEMWSSHPPNRAREDNAKTPYVESVRDERSAWSIFSDPDRVRRELTEVFNRVHLGMAVGVEPAELAEPARLDPRLAVFYSEDRLLAGAADPEQWLAGAAVAVDGAALADRHGDAMAELFARRRRHAEELQVLSEVGAGTRRLDRSTRFRGERLRARRVRPLFLEVQRELRDDVLAVGEAHRRIRRVCRTAAEQLGPEWVEAHRGALAVVHYVEHESLRVIASSRQLMGLLQYAQENTHTSLESIQRLCERLHDIHRGVAAEVARLAELRAPGWPDGLRETLLGEPYLGDWDPSWVRLFFGQLSHLQQSVVQAENAAIQALLDVEQSIADAWAARDGRAAPASAVVIPRHTPEPVSPTALIDAAAPPRVRGPSFAVPLRVAAVALLVAVPVGLRFTLGARTVTLYNGTRADALAWVGGSPVRVRPGHAEDHYVYWPGPVELVTQAPSGERVDRAVWPAAPAGARAIYNVGRHAVLYEEEVVYGFGEPGAPKLLGNPLLLPVDADYVLRDPPRSLDTSSGSARRTHVLDAAELVDAFAPFGILGERPEDLVAYAASVLLRDPPSAAWTAAAVALAGVSPERAQVLTAAARSAHPDDPEAHRAYQEARRSDPALVPQYRARVIADDSAISWYSLGRLLEGDEARQAYQNALARDPAMARASCALGSLEAQELAWDRVAEALAGCELEGAEAADTLLKRMLAHRWAGGVGVPDALDRPMELTPMFPRALFLVEADPSLLDVWIEREPRLAGRLALVAGDLERAKRDAAGDYGLQLLIALSSPGSVELADLLRDPPEDGMPPSAAWIGAAAAAQRGLPVERFLAALPPEEARRFAALRAADLRDLAAIDAVVRGAEGVEQGAIYAAAVQLSAEPLPELVERARRLSVPGTVPLPPPPPEVVAQE